MRMDAQRSVDLAAHIADDLAHEAGECAAVRVAENDTFGTRLRSSLQRFERIRAVPTVAVEEMLGVVKDAPPLRPQIGDTVVNHAQIFFERRLQDGLDMERRRLADDRADLRLGLDQRADIGVVLYARSCATGRAEGRDRGLLPVLVTRQTEEFGV